MKTSLFVLLMLLVGSQTAVGSQEPLDFSQELQNLIDKLKSDAVIERTRDPKTLPISEKGQSPFQSVKRVKVIIDQQYEGVHMPLLKREDVAGWFRIVGAEADVCLLSSAFSVSVVSIEFVVVLVMFLSRLTCRALRAGQVRIAHRTRRVPISRSR